MSTLSQFRGGSDSNRLKFKNGPFLDEVVNDGHQIRDFTAHNDNFIIAMSRGDIYVGKRLNELLPTYQMGRLNNILMPGVGITDYDTHIGGDPYGTPLDRVRTAFGVYTSSNTMEVSLGSVGLSPVTNYVKKAPDITLGVGNNNRTVSNISQGNINRFMYIDQKLFYINWTANTNQLIIWGYDQANDTWDQQPWTYSGSNLGSASGFFNGLSPMNTATGCTWPEIKPTTGDLYMFARIGSSNYEIKYDISTNAWVVSDVTTTNDMHSNEPMNIAFSDSEIVMTSSRYFRSSYWTSTDGGDNWTQRDIDSNDWRFKQMGCANNTFYTINSIGDDGATLCGGQLMSTTTPTNPNSWTYVNADITRCYYLRNNGNGTACYASSGSHGTLNLNNFAVPGHYIQKFTG